MFFIEVEKGNNFRNIVLQGDLIARNSFRAKEYFIAALYAQEQEINITIKSIRGLDFVFLQALCSFHRSCVKFGKTFKVVIPLDDKLKSFVLENNWVQNEECVFKETKDCLLLD